MIEEYLIAIGEPVHPSTDCPIVIKTSRNGLVEYFLYTSPTDSAPQILQISDIRKSYSIVKTSGLVLDRTRAWVIMQEGKFYITGQRNAVQVHPREVRAAS